MSGDTGPPTPGSSRPAPGRPPPNLKPMFAGLVALIAVCATAGYFLMPGEGSGEGDFRRATRQLAAKGEAAKGDDADGLKCIWAVDREAYFALGDGCTCAGALLRAGSQPVPPDCAALARCTQTEGCTTPLEQTPP